MWRIIFLPGFLFLWISYYMPIEWGKQRNIGRFRRQYKELLWFGLPSIRFALSLCFHPFVASDTGLINFDSLAIGLQFKGCSRYFWICLFRQWLAYNFLPRKETSFVCPRLSKLSLWLFRTHHTGHSNSLVYHLVAIYLLVDELHQLFSAVERLPVSWITNIVLR